MILRQFSVFYSVNLLCLFRHFERVLWLGKSRDPFCCNENLQLLSDDMDFLAIEVKNAAKLDSKDFSGLKSFASDYPEARTVLLYRGDVQYMHGNILVAPVGRYLCSLSPNEPFPDIKWRR